MTSKPVVRSGKCSSARALCNNHQCAKRPNSLASNCGRCALGGSEVAALKRRCRFRTGWRRLHGRAIEARWRVRALGGPSCRPDPL